ncbi:hypothetical protein EDC02_1870 [Micromonospora sp. Llam0]|uniref:YunG family protein n=1 Tax=Micromonospora sp. Llam0 TaxID=2485143 RepID=UPI000F4960AD|nr:hypothetical protein [Micromonospora sp. Llam0]ROO60021.1 hypothetical protein EDC02_1870 [Micromonospora sp. Llam0]
MFPRTWTLTHIERVIRTAWSADTCDPADLADWHTGNPARGQCGVTALVLHDLLGGELLVGEVSAGGRRTGQHWWNRLGVVEIDLTRDQFGPHERISGATVVDRPDGPPRRCREQYETLRTRVLKQLGADTTVAAGR